MHLTSIATLAVVAAIGAVDSTQTVAPAAHAEPKCWQRSDVPVTLRFPAEAGGQCVRVLAVNAQAHVNLDDAFVLTGRRILPEDPYLQRLPDGPAMRFSSEVAQVPIDTRPDRYVLVEGNAERWPGGSGGVVKEARVTSLTIDDLSRLVPDLAKRIADTREMAMTLKPAAWEPPEPPTLPFAMFPDEAGLRTILARLPTDGWGWNAHNPYAIDALALVQRRAPGLIKAHTEEVRAALEAVLSKTRKDYPRDVAAAECRVLRDCRAQEAHSYERFEKTKAGDDDRPYGWSLHDEWVPHAIAWLAKKPVWGGRERTVFEHYIAYAFERRFKWWLGAPLPLDAPRQKPVDWPAFREPVESVDLEWRAFTRGDGWTRLGELAVSGEAEPGAAYWDSLTNPQAPKTGPASSGMKLSLVNLSSAPIRVTAERGRLIASGSTRPATVTPPLDVEIPPRTWVIWKGHFQAPGEVGVDAQSSVVVTVRAGRQRGAVRMPYRVQVIS